MCVEEQWVTDTRRLESGRRAIDAEIKRQIWSRSESVPIVNNNWRDKRTLELDMRFVDLLASKTNSNQQKAVHLKYIWDYWNLVSVLLILISPSLLGKFRKSELFRVNFEYKLVRKKHLESKFDRSVCTFQGSRLGSDDDDRERVKRCLRFSILYSALQLTTGRKAIERGIFTVFTWINCSNAWIQMQPSTRKKRSSLESIQSFDLKCSQLTSSHLQRL